MGKMEKVNRDGVGVEKTGDERELSKIDLKDLREYVEKLIGDKKDERKNKPLEDFQKSLDSVRDVGDLKDAFSKFKRVPTSQQSLMDADGKVPLEVISEKVSKIATGGKLGK